MPPITTTTTTTTMNATSGTMDSIVIEKCSITSVNTLQITSSTTQAKHSGITKTKVVSRLPLAPSSATSTSAPVKTKAKLTQPSEIILEEGIQQVKRVEKRPWKLIRMFVPLEELTARLNQPLNEGYYHSPVKGMNLTPRKPMVVDSQIYSATTSDLDLDLDLDLDSTPPPKPTATAATAAAAAAAAAPSSEGGNSSALWVNLSAEELQVFRLLNLARTQPQLFADTLQRQLRYLVGNTFWWPDKPALRIREGRKAVMEAIQFLRAQEPCEAFQGLSNGLCLACRDLGLDTGRKGITGHIGSDDSDLHTRLLRYGTLEGTVYEDVLYGLGKAEDIVLQLIVDDNVPSRFHRRNLFRKEVQSVGVHVSPHLSYQHVAVVLYATSASFAELPTVQAKQMERWMQKQLLPTSATSALALEEEDSLERCCPGCNKEVAAFDGLYACGQKWHVSCCVCVLCKSTVVKYNNQNQKPCCPQCYGQITKNALRKQCQRCTHKITGKYAQLDDQDGVFCTPCFAEELKRLKREHIEL